MTSFQASALEDDPDGCALLKRVIAPASRRHRVGPSCTRARLVPWLSRIDRAVSGEVSSIDALGLPPKIARGFSYRITEAYPA